MDDPTCAECGFPRSAHRYGRCPGGDHDDTFTEEQQ